MKRIYIASPYTLGDVAQNVKTQIDMAVNLIDLGYAPYAPLLSHFLHMAHPRSYETWVEQDNEWVLVCDALLRLPGESKGADAEVILAQANGIPVYSSVNELLAGTRREANAACR
jgi:hypothetical protein